MRQSVLRKKLLLDLRMCCEIDVEAFVEQRIEQLVKMTSFRSLDFSGMIFPSIGDDRGDHVKSETPIIRPDWMKHDVTPRLDL